MPTTTTQIFNGTLSTTAFNVTNDLDDADLVYIVAPDIASELAIDIYLQIQVQSPVDLRRLPLDHDFVITNGDNANFYYSTLSELDTESIIAIPEQVRNLEYQKFLAISSSIAETLEVYAISSDGECECEAEFAEVQNRLTQLQLGQAVLGTSQLFQTIALGAFATSLGTVLAPATAGTSLALPGTVVPALAPSAAVLTTTSTLALLPFVL